MSRSSPATCEGARTRGAVSVMLGARLRIMKGCRASVYRCAETVCKA